MTPDALHLTVLAALADAEADLTTGTPAPWHVGATVGPATRCHLYSEQDGPGVAYDVPWQDSHLIVALRNTAAAAYAGARRIVERHAPMASGRCEHCWGRRRADAVWPCPDYRDATAALPHLPKEAADALRR